MLDVTPYISYNDHEYILQSNTCAPIYIISANSLFVIFPPIHEL
jgi:hypothetical protein